MKGKFLTTAILATLLVGSNSYASIARQAVMGTEPTFTSSVGTVNSVNGSLWYDDDYNVFYNPAYVNDNKNYVTVQKGLEGGFFKSEFENFAYGLYFNRGGATGAAGAGGAYGGGAGAGAFVAPGFTGLGTLIGGATNLNTQRPLDFFFGGDTGVKWGAHVAWAYNRNQEAGNNPSNADAEVTARYWHFDLGMEVMGFEPFIGATLFSKYQNTITLQQSTADLNEFDAGFRYKYEGWTPYFVFHKFRESGVAPGAPTQTQDRHNIWGVGVGHDTKVADGVHIQKNIGFWLNSVEDDNGAALATLGGQPGPDTQKNFKDIVIPLNVALEGEATSWLTLRAGIGYDLINQRKFASTNTTTNANPAPLTDRNKSLLGNSTFRIGSTLKFGKLHIDSAFGNGAAAAANGEQLDTSAVGFDSQTFALVSASYHW